MSFDQELSRPPYWYYCPKAISTDYFEVLRELAVNEAHHQTLKIYNKELLSNRISAVYADPEINHVPYWRDLPVYAWNPILLEIKYIVEQATDQTYQYVLLHLYRDYNDSLCYHCDKEAMTSNVVSLSFGATRRFLLKENKTENVTEINLQSRDVIIMTAECQHHFKHCVPKMTIADVNAHLESLGRQTLSKKWSAIEEYFTSHPEDIPQRINLTFRQI